MSKLIKIISPNYLANFCLLAILLLCSSFHPQPHGVNTVVIDAGHGGHDPGCLGRKSKEKDVALGISLKLGKLIEDNFPDVKVIYTRKTDQFVELNERANIANNAKADLFICIHCNSACFFNKKKKKEICSPEIAGVESWVMGLSKSDANLEVSKRENQVILLEKDYTRKYGGFDPNSPEANILFSLYQNTFLDQSLRMASFVQQEMKSINRTGRGVKQAGFLVLYQTSMPSILIETGFLSNAAEEKFLTSQKGQEQMAKAIYNAFKSYRNSIETQKTEGAKEDSTPMKKKTEEAPVEIVKMEFDTNDVKPKTTSTKDSVKPPKDSIKVAKDSVAVVKEPVPAPKSSPDSGVKWSVQFFTSPKPIPDNHKVYLKYPDAREFFENGIYKYSTGLLPEKSDAIRLQSKLREDGYKDAFVVAFLNDKKITIKEADALMQKK